MEKTGGIALLAGLLLLLNACATNSSDSQAHATRPTPKNTSAPKPYQGALFGWPFANPDSMQVRGGTSIGAPVTLDTQPSAAWSALQNLHGFERDRQAILALQGTYRASFQFIEVAGFSAPYQPPRPYFSWGTEHIHVLEDKGTFISLQHTLVMYVQTPDGTVQGPMLMKHWRQDWQYQNPNVFEYLGAGHWRKRRLNPAEVAGSWSQSVYQVDDSPRYQTLGRWEYGNNYAAWQSQPDTRPLPRREFTQRSDYNLLRGTHRLTLTPTGWIHEQNNQKLRRAFSDAEKSAVASDTFIGSEIGINRYERIQHDELVRTAEQYWNATGTYWQAVRNNWADILANNDHFVMKARFKGKPQFMYHFELAETFKNTAQTSTRKQLDAARDIINNFVTIPNKLSGKPYDKTYDKPSDKPQRKTDKK